MCTCVYIVSLPRLRIYLNVVLVVLLAVSAVVRSVPIHVIVVMIAPSRGPLLMLTVTAGRSAAVRHWLRVMMGLG